MTFYHLFLKKLIDIFNSHDFSIDQYDEDSVILKSPVVTILIAHDARENSNTFYAGFHDELPREITNDVITKIFHSTHILRISPSESFLDDLRNFLENEGLAILEGNISKLRALKDYQWQKAKNYTNQIIGEQNLNTANKAWSEGDYETFIAIMEKLNKDELPSSYQLKYKIAKKRVG